MAPSWSRLSLPSVACDSDTSTSLYLLFSRLRGPLLFVLPVRRSFTAGVTALSRADSLDAYYALQLPSLPFYERPIHRREAKDQLAHDQRDFLRICFSRECRAYLRGGAESR